MTPVESVLILLVAALVISNGLAWAVIVRLSSADLSILGRLDVLESEKVRAMTEAARRRLGERGEL